MQPDSTDFWDATPSGDVVLTRNVSRNQWFSGAFTYGLPKGDSALSGLHRHYLEAGKLLGTSLTPETLWELSPWSWAVDWFSNTGDVISNLSDWALYGLVMQYGYIMEHTIVSDTYTTTPTGIKGVKSSTPLTFVTETKTRKRANPFGFGVAWNGLNPIQLGILAALGITRS